MSYWEKVLSDLVESGEQNKVVFGNFTFAEQIKLSAVKMWNQIEWTPPGGYTSGEIEFRVDDKDTARFQMLMNDMSSTDKESRQLGLKNFQKLCKR